MARKTKTGLDYFPFDVNFFDDDKIQFVSARFGDKGENIAIKLLCKIYKDKGYYCAWGNDELLLFAKRAGHAHTLVNDVVDELLRRGFFDETIFKSFEILTSKGIQERYLEAADRRIRVVLIAEYLAQGVKESINVGINKQNVYINTLNDSISTQSKVKESKVKESNLNKETREKFFFINGETQFVPVSEYQKQNFGQFIEQWVMKAPGEKSQKEAFLARVFEAVDTKYLAHDFRDLNHVKNAFTHTWGELLKSNSQKNYGGKNKQTTLRPGGPGAF